MRDPEDARAHLAALAVGLHATDRQVLRAYAQITVAELTLTQVQALASEHFDAGALAAASTLGAVIAVDTQGGVMYCDGPLSGLVPGADLLACCHMVGATAVVSAIESALAGNFVRAIPGYQPFDCSPLLLRGNVVGAVLSRLS